MIFHLQWASVQGATTSAARPALRQSPPLGSCLTRLLQMFRACTRQATFWCPSSTDVPAPSECWRPRARACPATARAMPAASVAPAGDEVLAMQLLFASSESFHRPPWMKRWRWLCVWARERNQRAGTERDGTSRDGTSAAPSFCAKARQRAQAHCSREQRRASEPASWGISSPSVLPETERSMARFLCAFVGPGWERRQLGR